MKRLMIEVGGNGRGKKVAGSFSLESLLEGLGEKVQLLESTTGHRIN